jgi:hypothetical protein
LGIEPALQNEGGGELVDDASAYMAAEVAISGMVAHGFECSMGFGGGEALVPEVDGEAGVVHICRVFALGGWLGDERFELVHKTMDSLGLAAAVSGEVERIADHDAGATMAACEAEDGALVPAGLRAFDGEQRLRDAKRVGERDTDTARADIEAQPWL